MHWKHALVMAVSVLAADPLTPAVEALELRAAQPTVGRHERIEFTVSGLGEYANPYEPAEVDLSLEFTSPSGRKLRVPAFYAQDYERQSRARGGGQSQSLYPVGRPAWKARFAPGEIGRYSCLARLADTRGVLSSEPVGFECVQSKSQGYMRISPSDPRFFELDDGSPFFPIGQNAAFVKDTYELETTLRQMSDQGANFARIWTCCEDWGMAVEARKSAWGRSWDWRPPIVLAPGREGYLADRWCVRLMGEPGQGLSVSPSHAVGLRPGRPYCLLGKLRTSEGASVTVEVFGQRLGEPLTAAGQWKAFKREFTTGPNNWWLEGLGLRLAGKGTAWVRELSLKEAGEETELLWEADLERPVMGQYNQVDCFMLDKVIEAAEANNIKLQLCLFTRDLYMDSLRRLDAADYARATRAARQFLRYAVGRWGYSTSVAVWEYFNEMDPGLPTERFYNELGQYLEQIDVYRHLRATSAWSAAPKDWRQAKLDVANLHWYLRPTEGPLFEDEVRAVLDRASFLLRESPGKPALWAEYGITTDNWQRSPYLAEAPAYAHLHNGLWASALSGLSGSVLSWWWEDLARQNGFRHYRAVAAFMADVPFSRAKLRSAAGKAQEPRWRVLGLQGEPGAWLWVSDAEATWHKQAVRKQPVTESRDVTISVGELTPGPYEVSWWDTLSGEVLRREECQSRDGTLSLKPPPFTSDIACKVLLK